MRDVRVRMRVPVLCATVLCCSAALAQGPAEQVDLICPAATSAVTVDGRLDEPAWQAASETVSLLIAQVLTEPKGERTDLRVLYDDRTLLLGVTCEAATADAPARLPHDEPRMWQAERLELFLDPTPDSDDYFHFLFDRAANVWDAWRRPADPADEGPGWSAQVRAAAAPTADGWAIEIAIPFADLGVEPVAPGDLWRLKLGRDGGRSGPMMWPPNPSGAFHDRLVDGALYFDTMNLLRGGDFEAGEVGPGAPAPWSASLTSPEVDNAPQGDVRTVEGGVPPGRCALLVQKLVTALWWPQVWNAGYQLVPGGTYEFSIMARGDLPQVNLRASSMVEGTSIKISQTRDVPKQFERLYLQFVVAEAAESVQVGLSAPRGAGGEVLYDDAMLRRVLRAPGAERREYRAPEWGPGPDPIHGLEALVERAGHKPWELFTRGEELLPNRVVFRDREFGTELWLTDNSPCREYVITASVWPGWNADCSVLLISGSRMLNGESRSYWLCNADFSRMRQMPLRAQPLWDRENPDLYYVHTQGKVERVDLRTGAVTELASWQPRGSERSYGVTKDNRHVFVTDWDGGEWLPYTEAEPRLPNFSVLDCYGKDPDGDGRLPVLGITAETPTGPKLRVVIGTLVDTRTGETRRIIAPISGHTEYLKTFISGRVQFPDHTPVVPTRDLEELFQVYHNLPSCSHGHISYSPDGEYDCWDGTCHFYRTRDLGDRHEVRISETGSVYHTCWFYDQRFFTTCVRAYRTYYDRPDNAGILAQVFTDGTWQPIADIKMRPNAFYYGGNFATFSRDATKIHYESSMTGVPKNYVAVMARPQSPRQLNARVEGGAAVLSWQAPPHHAEIKGYLVYRSSRSGDGYEQVTTEPVVGTTWRDEAAPAGAAGYYVATALEHSGLESGYSNEAIAGSVPADAALVVYAECEDALVDLRSGDRPGITRGRDRLGASNWYYVYRHPEVKEGSAAAPVTIPADGRYSVWLRVRRAGESAARWQVAVADAPAVSFDATGEDWEWVRAAGGPLQLRAGATTATLTTDGAGAQADLICLTTDPDLTPRGPRPEDTQPPAPPGGLQVEAVEGRHVAISWQQVAAPDLRHYNVYGAREPITEPRQEQLLGSPTYEQFIDWGLRADTTYHYAITAVDRRGNESALSQVISATTPPAEHESWQEELHFDRAELTGPFERKTEEGTHAEQYVILPAGGAEHGVRWQVELPHDGDYYLWLRYLPGGAAGSRAAAVEQRITARLDGESIVTLGRGLTDLSLPDGHVRPEFWTWARPVAADLEAVRLPAGRHELTLENLTAEIRYDSLLITNEPSFLPPDGRLRQQ